MGNIKRQKYSSLPNSAKAIPGYPTYYATPDGEIWRKAPPYKAGFGMVSEKIIKLKSRKNERTGYWQIQPYINGKKKNNTVHRLVLTTFKGEGPKGYECDHIDANRSNNHIDNLQWLPKNENIKKALKVRWDSLDF